MNTTSRHLTPFDRLLDGVETALNVVAGTPAADRPCPSVPLGPVELDAHERRHVAGLMRVNHTGEVCAQALYQGQAMLARDETTRAHLEQAAAEETDHLAWCASRLDELDARPSLFNPLWYAGSHAIGAVAAAIGDRISLGFVVETERQVEAHLADHIARLPGQDHRSRAILEQMQADEIRHADNALARGGAPLPPPVPTLMKLASKVMKTVAYRV
ncbi:MAG TPA: 2-polyprenyl-3-methyl-6-methoxy-1,4-benzoquinone monooxygenase [Rhodanobacteraceae bacterium]|nr:2-polyprenyl-3-methyl-6-methoxy-1,4-benzoquinone monooxygenase [Rhodanobacteraceae bacterium]